MRKVLLVSLLMWLIFTSIAFAHDSQSAAPDMHPLFVLLEFIVVLYLGASVAKWLSSIGKTK